MRLNLRRIRVRQHGPVPTSTGAEWELIGQDGGQSVDLGDGRSLFLYGDTLTRPTRPGAATDGLFLANTAAIGRGATLGEVLGGLTYLEGGGLPRVFLLANERERIASARVWPLHGARVRDGVVVYYMVIRQTGRGTWDFSHLGNGVARVDPTTLEAQRLTSGVQSGWWPAGPDGVSVGTWVLHEGETLYVYGGWRRGLEWRAFVGRVRADEAFHRDAYAWLRADGTWGDGLENRADLGPSGSGCSVHRTAEGYLMTYVDPFDRTLRLRLAPSPWGPFDAPLVVARLAGAEGDDLVYAGVAHPQLAEHDRFGVTWSRAHFARNHWLEITLRPA